MGYWERNAAAPLLRGHCCSGRDYIVPLAVLSGLSDQILLDAQRYRLQHLANADAVPSGKTPAEMRPSGLPAGLPRLAIHSPASLTALAWLPTAAQRFPMLSPIAFQPCLVQSWVGGRSLGLTQLLSNGSYSMSLVLVADWFVCGVGHIDTPLGQAVHRLGQERQSYLCQPFLSCTPCR